MREDLLRVGYHFFASIHNSKVGGVYIKGNLLRIDRLLEEENECLDGLYEFPNIMMELEQSKNLFAYFDLERYVFVVQIGSNQYRGPYNEETYFEPEFEVKGNSLYYLFPLLDEQIKRDESEKIVEFYHHAIKKDRKVLVKDYFYQK